MPPTDARRAHFTWSVLLLSGALVGPAWAKPGAPKPKAGSSAAPSCEQAADASLRILIRDLPDTFGDLTAQQLRDTRTGLVGQCEVHPWDEPERRCIVAARNDDELGDCHSEGDHRRHPEWRHPPPR